MFPRRIAFQVLAAAVVTLVAETRVAAQLAANSPFLPAAGSGAAAPVQPPSLEFRAMIEMPDGMKFRLYDPVKKVGTWARANERNSDFGVTVKQYDAARKILVVDQDGRTLSLPEREGKVVSSGVAPQVMPTPMPMPMPGQNVAPPIGQQAVVNPTAAEEQKRLEAVASEVARRRAMREQAAQPGVPAAPVQIQGQQPTTNFQPNGQPVNNPGGRGGPRQQP